MTEMDMFNEALRLPTNNIDYYVSQRLADRFPDKAIIHGEDSLFNVEGYAFAQQCTFGVAHSLYSDIVTYWRGQKKNLMSDPNAQALKMSGIVPQSTWSKKGLQERAKNAWFTIMWREHPLDVVVMNWGDLFSKAYHYWIVADTKAIAEDFLIAVCEYNVEVRGEVLVFDGGCWQKDEGLLQDIQDATLDNLVLRGTLKQEIFVDLEQFFVSRQLYEAHHIPWKRGIVFAGPPGNGKTHAVKALINSLKQPCLYVKSLKADFGPEDENIKRVFQRARRSAPCILVLEDLDSLLTAQNRSFFLNELDGFAANTGVVALATTNHPERLDASILDRPSRFDRKYPFDLPAQPERLTYIQLWNSSLEAELRLSDAVVSQVSTETEGFSFAYLKELFLSSMMNWVAAHQAGTMDRVMVDQVVLLRAQMVSTATNSAINEQPDVDENNPLSAFARMMASAQRTT